MDSNMFILLMGSLKSVCLICSITLLIIKGSNVKCLCETKHKSFKQTYPLKSELRAPKIEQPSPLWTLFEQNIVSRVTLNTYIHTCMRIQNPGWSSLLSPILFQDATLILHVIRKEHLFVIEVLTYSPCSSIWKLIILLKHIYKI